MSASVQCPRCSEPSRASARFCGACGAPLHKGAATASAERPRQGTAPSPTRSTDAADAVFRVSVEPRELTVAPGGEPQEVHVRVYNLSDVIEEFEIALLVDDSGLAPTSQTLRLLPNSDDTTALAIGFPARQLVPAGPRTVALDIRAVGVHHVARRQWLRVHVPATEAQLTAELSPDVVRGSQAHRVRLTVANPSNVPLRVRLRGRDPEEALRFRFHPPTLDLPPGGSATGWVQVSAPQRPWTGGEKARPFTVEVGDGQSTASAAGTLLQQPVLTEARRTALRITLTVAGSLALIAGAFLTWTTEPFARTGMQWTVPDHVDLVFRGQVPLRPPADFVPDAATSAGLGAIVLGGFAILGLFGRGRGTRMAAGLAFVLLAAFFVLLAFTGPLTLAAGAWLCLGGALVAFAGGLLGKR